MSDEPKPPLAQSGIRWMWIAALVIVADQLSKIWIQENVVLWKEVIELLPVLNIHHTFNTGAAWSFCADCGGAQRWIFSGLAVVVSVVLLVWLRRLSLATNKLLITGLTLIVGGAIGNLI